MFIKKITKSKFLKVGKNVRNSFFGTNSSKKRAAVRGFADSIARGGISKRGMLEKLKEEYGYNPKRRGKIVGEIFDPSKPEKRNFASQTKAIDDSAIRSEERNRIGILSRVVRGKKSEAKDIGIKIEETGFAGGNKSNLGSSLEKMGSGGVGNSKMGNSGGGLPPRMPF